MKKKTENTSESNCWVLSRLEDGRTIDKIKFKDGDLVPFSFNLAHTKKNLKKKLFAVDENIANLLDKKL
jgi:hypothetical protein